MNSASFPRVILKHVTTPYQEREDQLQQLSARSWEHLVRGEFGIGEQVAREFLELAKDASAAWHSERKATISFCLTRAFAFLLSTLLSWLWTSVST